MDSCWSVSLRRCITFVIQAEIMICYLLLPRSPLDLKALIFTPFMNADSLKYIISITNSIKIICSLKSSSCFDCGNKLDSAHLQNLTQSKPQDDSVKRS